MKLSNHLTSVISVALPVFGVSLKSPTHRAMLRGDASVNEASRNLQSCPNSASNLGFELGNFNCWHQYFTYPYTVSVQSGSPSAPYGNKLARIGGGCGGVFGGDGTNKISKTISRNDLVAIKGVAKWDGGDYLPFDDSAKIIAVYDQGSKLLFQASISQYGNYGTGPWIPFSFALPSGENEFTIEVSSTNKLDCALDSAVYVDFAPIVVNPGGPYLVHAGAEGVQLEGETSDYESEHDEVTMEWSSDCVGAVFDDATALDATLSFPDTAEPQVCTITLTAFDGTDALAEASTMVTVVNPSSDFVTGGGWIESPVGAFLPDELYFGPASFGFVSMYKKGKSIPSGETSFLFEAASLSFESTSYDWLVITGADCAKYKGLGLLNVAGDETEAGFMLTACDGGEGNDAADTFRIKIWDANDESVIYDNKLGGGDESWEGTVISGGNIQIHRKK